jgi:hypothetical protein
LTFGPRGGRGRVVPAVHIARDGIGLADRAIETRESGAIRRNQIRPGPWRLHRRAWFGLSPVRGNRLDRRLCSANVIMEPRWRPAKQRCPDPATALALILVGGRSDGPYRGRSRMLFVSRGTESSQTLRWRKPVSVHGPQIPSQLQRRHPACSPSAPWCEPGFQHDRSAIAEAASQFQKGQDQQARTSGSTSKSTNLE